jgi:transposase InsO family protein
MAPKTRPVHPYHWVSSEIAMEKGLLMRGSRIIIPNSLQQEMLDKVHEGHQGITKGRERARESIWWPRLSRRLEEVVSQKLHEVLQAQAQRAEPMISSPLPELPWQKVGTDLFELKGHTYLLIVDYYSRFIEVAKLNPSTAAEVITHMKSIFARHGIPETVVSDNGPQFSSKMFKEFSEDYQFTHRTSSPYYPQSNGKAEQAVVGTIKNILKKAEDPYKAILAYRATSLQSGHSPLMCRRLRTTLPCTKKQLTPTLPDVSTFKLVTNTSRAGRNPTSTGDEE